ncbi:MAG: PSD1 domain-containing protein [Planctomycetales bacterium]|nr:PSD1 domain-containing protein [Planctomycetales bacterium]
MHRSFPFALLTLCLWVFSGAAPAAGDEPAVDFSRDILPLLSNNCFQCHGPAESGREAGLRLDQRAAATAQLESGKSAIVPGKSADSELVRRLVTEDLDERMPPPDTGKSLSPEQVALIKRWIDNGAEWTGHWSFQPPRSPHVPDATPGWRVVNPIDLFIQQRMQQAKLAPEPPANKETLIRRVTLDLTGMPATLAEVDAFLADDSEQAYERVVDRLLNSPRYGEHLARIWLDAARYGDTHGLHLDNERSIWPYRDWVIDSFNRNQPFDQFTIEQLAGDLLPNATLQQRVATGFNRCNVTTSEGGSIDDEYYVRYAVDRVETTATVWLGLTASCASCHDHKFDPLTQREFYQLFSYFYSLTERAMDGNALLPPPVVKVPSAEQAAAKERLTAELADADAQIARVLDSFQYVDPRPNEPLGELVRAERIWIDDVLPAGAKPQGDGPEPWKFVEAPDHPVHLGVKSTVRSGSGGGITQHFFTDATDKLTIGEDSRLFAFVYLDPQDPPATIQLQFNDGSWEHRASWGADKAFGAGRNDASNRQMGALPELGKWIRLEVTAEAVGLKPGSELNGWAFTQVDGTVHWDAAGIASQAMSDEQKKSLSAWEQYRKLAKAPALPGEIQKLLDLAADQRNDAQRMQLTRYYLEHVHPDARQQLAAPRQRQVQLKAELDQVENAIPGTLVMEDRAEPRQAFVLERGEYTLKRDKVDSDVPAWIAPPVPGAGANRLGLAKWLVQPSHPLTSRVTVNRFWQLVFGTGLVKTSEDFGVQGERPSHPELLDWLAIDFVQSGWDVKRCLKQMVMSATYQQSSRVEPAKLAADPGNRLLARGARFRLDAEVIRDQALAVSGLLNGVIGGKSVRPYQPAGLWKPVGFGGSNTSVFVQDQGEKLYRRSMYTFWKRTSPPPSMATFDAPNRETCQVRRARTNTPLQALVLLNDVQFVESARRFAERVVRQGGDSVEQRAEFAFRTMLARRPSESELRQLTSFWQEQHERFRQAPESAAKLVAIGESTRDEQLDAVELAAWTMLTHVLMNLSETVTRG